MAQDFPPATTGGAAEALGPDGAEGRLLDALRWLERAAPQAEGGLDAALDGLARALAELAEASGAVDAALEAGDADPGELERVEERLSHLERMVDDLSEVIARQDGELRRMARRVGMLMEREADREAAEGNTIPLADQRPPHW